MTERPMLYSAPMVLALLANRKRMTRRIVGWQPLKGEEKTNLLFSGVSVGEYNTGNVESGHVLYVRRHGGVWHITEPLHCPYGRVGDRLWVKETWRVARKFDRTKPVNLPFDRGITTAYAAGGIKCRDSVGGPYVSHPESDLWNADWLGKVRPSLFMTRAASRLTLEITDVRIERVQAITEADAIAEGVEQRTLGTAKFWRGYAADEEGTPGIALTARESFASLWSVINGEKSWDANPWVWVVSFKPIEVTP